MLLARQTKMFRPKNFKVSVPTRSKSTVYFEYTNEGVGFQLSSVNSDHARVYKVKHTKNKLELPKVNRS